MRLVLIVAVAATAGGPSASRISSANNPTVANSLVPDRWRESALAPSLVFMSRALNASAFAVRRLIEPYTWAVAGEPRVRMEAWEFEPADNLGRIPSIVRSDDHCQRSGTRLSGWEATRRAQSILERLRQRPMRSEPLPLDKRLVEGRVAGSLVEEGVPPALALRLAHQLVLRRDLSHEQDPEVWRAMGRVVLREADQLRVYIGLTDYQIATVLPKLSADDVQDLSLWLETTDRTIARTIFAAAIETADPITAGRTYLANYRLALRKAKIMDPTMARAVASLAFRKRKISSEVLKQILANLTRAQRTLLLAAAFVIAELLWCRGESGNRLLMLAGLVMPTGLFAGPPAVSWNIRGRIALASAA
jgi:hypothetical protein